LEVVATPHTHTHTCTALWGEVLLHGVRDR